MCAKILLITCRSSMHAMIFIAPWQCLHTVTSILNTRFSRIAQLIFPRRASHSAVGSVAVDANQRGQTRLKSHRLAAVLLRDECDCSSKHNCESDIDALPPPSAIYLKKIDSRLHHK